jgi:hypothetical protein
MLLRYQTSPGLARLFSFRTICGFHGSAEEMGIIGAASSPARFGGGAGGDGNIPSISPRRGMKWAEAKANGCRKTVATFSFFDTKTGFGASGCHSNKSSVIQWPWFALADLWADDEIAGSSRHSPPRQAGGLDANVRFRNLPLRRLNCWVSGNRPCAFLKLVGGSTKGPSFCKSLRINRNRCNVPR